MSGTQTVAFCVVFVTCPTKTAARKLAQRVLQVKAAACVNILPSVSSHYWWQGKIERSSEVLLILKTRRDRYVLLEKTIRAGHPYQVPEILALPILSGSKPYLNWIDSSLIS